MNTYPKAQTRDDISGVEGSIPAVSLEEFVADLLRSEPEPVETNARHSRKK
jgi:hypothetical protein